MAEILIRLQKTTDLFAVTTAISQTIMEAAQREGIDLFLLTQQVLEAIRADEQNMIQLF